MNFVLHNSREGKDSYKYATCLAYYNQKNKLVKSSKYDLRVVTWDGLQSN